MKKIYIIAFAFLGITYTNAQVGIETETVRDGALLDFPTPADKGILLPKHTDVSNSGSEAGSLAFDVATQKVVYYSDKIVNGSPEGWVPLTKSPTTAIASDKANFANAEEVGEGVLVTDEATAPTSVAGVLELKSDSKALILPTVDTVNDLPVAEAGMICYVKDAKTLAVFNGEKWSFWK